MASPPAPPSQLSRETVQKAVNSLFKWRRAHSSVEGRDEDDYFNLIVTLKRIPSRQIRLSYRIELPTPLRLASESEICLIVDDRRMSKLQKVRMMKSKLNGSEKEVKVSAEEAGVSKVLKISKLKSDYGSLEEKRKLWDEFDVFLAEKRIAESLPGLLGKHFYKNKKKVPLEVELKGGSMSWREEVEKAVGSGYMHLSSGTCSVVKVGRFGMKKEEIVENVVAAVERIVEVIPKKWDGVRSFHLKLNESLALPIYEAMTEVELDVVEDSVEGKKNADTDEILRNKGEYDNYESDSDVAGKGESANGRRKSGAEETDKDDFASMKRTNGVKESAIRLGGNRQLELA